MPVLIDFPVNEVVPVYPTSFSSLIAASSAVLLEKIKPRNQKPSLKLQYNMVMFKVETFSSYLFVDFVEFCTISS